MREKERDTETEKRRGTGREREREKERKRKQIMNRKSGKDCQMLNRAIFLQGMGPIPV